MTNGVYRSPAQLAQMGQVHYWGTYYVCRTPEDFTKHAEQLERQRAFTGNWDDWNSFCMFGPNWKTEVEEARKRMQECENRNANH